MLDTRQMMPVAVRRGRGAVLEQMRDAVVVLDERRRVVDANAAALELLGTEREAVLGEHAADALDVDSIDVESGSEPTTLERDDRIYEVRSSPIVGDADEPVGYTLVARDITERERRTRTLANQREELERLSDLNGVLRGVNQVLVSARNREEIERAVCDRLAESERFAAACIGGVQTWAGDADRWTVAGDRDPDGLTVSALRRSPVARSDGGASVRRTFERTADPSVADAAVAGDSTDDTDSPDAAVEPADTWVVVPLLYGSTVYGALGLCTDRESVSDRERAVLLEWTLAGDVPLRSFVESGANVQHASACEGTITYRFEVASDADVRSLVDRVRRRFPGVRLQSKAERSEPARVPEATPLPNDADLTERQREALEAAYRSGYFSWPRDSTAEEIAGSLDVAPSTLHSHLRKTEGAIVGAFLDGESQRR